MKNSFLLKRKTVPFPPSFCVEGFDQDALKGIVEQKISELKKSCRKVEREAKSKEDFAYQQLNSVREYSIPWLEAMVYLYGLEAKRENFKVWTRYWERVGGIYEIPKYNGGITHLDIEKAREYPIQELLDTPYKNAGSARLKALCSFHEEKTPSFVIYTNDNSAHCFGCNKHIGNAVDFLMERDNLEFKEAVKKLI